MAYQSSYPSTSTLAPAYGNFAAFSRVDVESLLWEMSHIVRGLAKVTRVQSAELAQLGAGSSDLASEYEERASAALRAVDTALDQMAADVLVQEDDAWFDVDRQGVAAWAHETQEELRRMDEPATPGDIPADFWETHDFNWDDEPEELDVAVPPIPEEVVSELPADAEDDELVLPSDSISSFADDDSENDYDAEEWEGYSDASFEAGEQEFFSSQPAYASPQLPVIIHDDTATLFHPQAVQYPTQNTPATDNESAFRALRRHSWLGSHKHVSGFDSAAALFGKLFQQTHAMPLAAGF